MLRGLPVHRPVEILKGLARKMDFRARIIVYLCMFAGVVSLPLFFATYLYASRSLEANAMADSVQVADLTAQRIDALFKEMDNLALNAVYNASIMAIVTRASHSEAATNYYAFNLADARTLLENLSRIAYSPPFDCRISLFNARLDYISYGGLNDEAQSAQGFLHSAAFSSLYHRILSQGGRRLILPAHEDFWSPQSHLGLLSILREMRDMRSSYGVIEVDVPYTLLQALCDVPKAHGTRLFVIGPTGDVLYPAGGEGLLQAASLAPLYLSKVSAAGPGSSMLRMQNPETRAAEIVTSLVSSYAGVRVVSVQPLAQILMPIRLLRNAWLVILISVLAFSGLLVLFIASQLTRPLVALKDSVRKASMENPTISLVNRNHDSVLAQLNEAFEEMFRRLRTSMDQVVMLRARELNAHVLALQSQMNPHFLYNTLAVMMATAQESGANRTVEIGDRLSRMLRYVTSYQATESTIAAEIEYARDYLKLMRERYEDRFQFAVDVDDRLGEVRVPKLIVQPLAENCFLHGFRRVRPPWWVRVSVTQSDGRWTIVVEDNGIGVEPGLAAALEEQATKMVADAALRLDPLGVGRLGLLNTLVRLKLRYADSYLFRVERRSPVGTSVTLGACCRDTSVAG